MSGQKITGLADGTANTDAVNLGQLDKKVNDVKTELDGDINNAKTELKGDIETAKTELNTNINNAKDELTAKGLKFKGDNETVITRPLGEQLDIVGDSKNISTESNGTSIKITMSDTPNFTNITTTAGAAIGGDLGVTGSTTLGDTTIGGNDKTLNVAEGTTVNMGGNVITNVSSGGDTDTNAANIADVKKIAKQSSSIVKSEDESVTVTESSDAEGKKVFDLAVNATKLADDISLNYAGDSGTGTNKLSGSVKFAGSEGEIVTTAKDGEVSFKLADTIKDKINQSADDIATKGLTFTGTEGDTGVKKLGESVAIIGANDNIKTTASTAEGVKIELNNTLNLTDVGSVNFGDGNAKLNKDGLTAGDVSVTKNGINAGNKTIGGVADGTADDHAVNLSQLNATKAIAEKGWNVTIAQGTGEASAPTSEEKVAPGETVIYKADKNIKLTQNGKEISIATKDDVTFTSTNAGALTANSATVNGEINLNGATTITGGTLTANNGASISSGLSMNDSKITGLADGVDTKDAVNKGQLDSAKIELNTKIDDTKTELNNKIDDTKTELNNKIDDTKTELNTKIDDTKTELNTKIDGAKTELQGDINNAKDELTAKGMDYKGENGEVIHKALGEQLDIIGDNKNVST
ncbi:hypothetical protein ACWIYZ_08770, partial [Ursidibacter arcticus]